MAPRQQPLNDEQRTTAENHRTDAPGQRGQPGVRPGSHRRPGECHAGPHAQRRLGGVGNAGHDRKTPAPLLPHQPSRGLAVRQRPPAPQPQGGGPGLRSGIGFHPAGRAARRLPGAVRPGPRPPASTWRTRGRPPSPPLCRWMPTSTVAPTATNTRLGPPPRGEWRCPCDAWPCWSRSTAWPPT